MLGKIKKVLGIEGVKVKLKVKDTYDRSVETINGTVIFTTKTDSKVRSYRLTLIETYSRGRGKSKMTDEYPLGKLAANEPFELLADQALEVSFEMPFDFIHSEMDRIQKGNFLSAGIISLAKKIKGVKSTYTLRVEADIVGTKLDPFDKVEIHFH